MTTVVVFGGGGFVGRRLVDSLTANGMTVYVAVRHPDVARSELRSIGCDRATVIQADVRDQNSVAEALAGADAVVNAVSAYVEKGGVTFEDVHVKGAETVARQAAAAGIARLVQLGPSPRGQTATARTNPLCYGRDPGAPIRAPTASTTHHQSG
jgi:uncharacterized protein YbjT (DUF2867 family)